MYATECNVRNCNVRNVYGTLLSRNATQRKVRNPMAGNTMVMCRFCRCRTTAFNDDEQRRLLAVAGCSANWLPMEIACYKIELAANANSLL